MILSGISYFMHHDIHAIIAIILMWFLKISWKQYQQTNLEEYHDKFKEIRNEVVYAIRESKTNM